MLSMLKDFIKQPGTELDASKLGANEHEKKAFKHLGGQFKQFFQMMKKPHVQTEQSEKALPGFLQPLMNFLGGAMNMTDPKHQKIWKATQSATQFSFAVEFISSILRMFVGPKVSAKIAPLFNGILGMLGLQKQKIEDQLVEQGQFSKKEMDDYRQKANSGGQDLTEIAHTGLHAFKNFTQKSSRKFQKEKFGAEIKPRRRMRSMRRMG